MDTLSTVAYEIDEDDRIVAVNAAWTEFATANQAGHLVADQVVQRSMWEIITSYEVRFLYTQMFAYVRRTGTVVRFAFRCDSPDARRHMRMALHRQPRQHILLISETIDIEPRPYMALFDVHMPRQDELLNVCSWCNRVELPDGGWAEVEAAVNARKLFTQSTLPLLSHGMCPGCHQAMHAEIARYAKQGAAAS